MSQQLLASDDGGDHGQIHSLPRDDGGGDWASHGGTLHDLSEPTNPLHYAAATGTRADLRRLLKAGEQVQSVDHFGRTALVYAAVADIVQNAEYLLKKGADVDAVDNDGRTPLHWATFHAKTGMIKVLLAHGANPLAVDNEGRSVLHLAQDSESLAVYEAAMQPQPPWDVADNTGRTPLAWAAHAGLSDVVAYLLQHSSVAFVDDESRGPFHWGCLSGDVLTVQKLMAAAGETVLDDADSEGGKEQDFCCVVYLLCVPCFRLLCRPLHLAPLGILPVAAFSVAGSSTTTFLFFFLDAHVVKTSLPRTSHAINSPLVPKQKFPPPCFFFSFFFLVVNNVVCRDVRHCFLLLHPGAWPWLTL
eukprot:m.391732 g.391732  ORF g.391732 m.391732 type:complete len:360 (-) comp20081_c0_seq23:2695-3774(-)